MRAALATAAAALLLTGPASAQVMPRPDAEAAALAGVHVAPRARGTVVGTVVLVPTGSAADGLASPGTAHTLAEVLAAGARRRLPVGADLAVRVERDWTAFTLLSSPDAWPDALEALASALFREPVPEDLVAPVRDDLLARFVFEEGAPVREFQRELYGVLTSTADPWARSPRGHADAVRELGVGALAAFRRERYDRGSARVAVVGPVAPVSARAAVAAAGLGGRAVLPRPPDDDRAWDDGDRVLLEREVTNAWIAVMLPAPGDLPRTRLEVLAHRLDEELNPTTPDPGIFAAAARVQDTPDGAVLLVEAAVFPESAGAWERRILAMVDDLEDAAEPAFFRWQRRRFRSARLLEESAPEVEAMRAALDLLREGRVRDLPAEIWELTPEAVADAADDLGEPRILILGPDLTDGSR